MPKCLGRPETRAGNREGNQRRGGMMGTVGGTAQGHQRDAPPSVHWPQGPPRPPHLALPRPAPPAPRPHPRLAKGARHPRRTYNHPGAHDVCDIRARLVAAGAAQRAGPSRPPSPRPRRRRPGPPPRRILSSAPPSAHPLGHLPGRTALHLHSAAAARLGCGFTSDPGSGPCHQRPWPRPGPLDHRPPRCGGLDVERHGAHRGVATELALKAAPRGRAQQGRRRCG